MTDVLPRPEEILVGCVLQLRGKVTGYPVPILAVCDGEGRGGPHGLSTVGPPANAVSYNIDVQGSLQAKLGEYSIKIEVPKLFVAIKYDFMQGGREEDLLIDASTMPRFS